MPASPYKPLAQRPLSKGRRLPRSIPVENCIRIFRPVISVVACLLGLVTSARATLTTPTTGAIAASDSYVVALKSNGTVWTWGFSGYGPPHVGTRSVPVPMTSLADIVAIDLNRDHAVTLKNDGTVWEWWKSIESPGTLAPPVQVSGLTNVVAVAAGAGGSYTYGFAVKSDGTLWSWGEDQYGGSSGEAVQVSGLTNVVAVAAAPHDDVVLKSDGTVWSLWHDEDGNVSLQPAQVAGLSGVTAVAAAASGYFAAVKSDGTVWMWGTADGLVGTGTSETGWWPPTQVTGLSGITAVSMENGCIVARKSDGSVWTWGNNGSRQLGDGTTTSRAAPAQVSGVGDVISVAVGGEVVVALKSDGSVRVWGEGNWGEWGNGITAQPGGLIQVGPFNDVIALSADAQTVLVRSDGTVWSAGGGYGYDFAGFRQVTGLSGVKAVAAAGQTLALKNDGTVWQADSMTGIPGVVAGLSNVTAIAAAREHYLALKADGTVWAWGSNWNGESGAESPFGPFEIVAEPHQISGLSGVIAIAAGPFTSSALKSDGTVWSWGENWAGKLGAVTAESFTIAPVQAVGLQHVVAIAARGGSITAIVNDGSTNNGTVWSTGVDEEALSVPTLIPGLTHMTAVSALSFETAALKDDGTVWFWGIPSEAEPYDHPPAQLVAFTGAAKVAAGVFGTLALMSDGTVRGLGDNRRGQMGIPFRLEPAAIRLTSSSADTDQDGMADTWETQYFGNLSHDGGDDTDGDGLTDIQEFYNGSNPVQPDADGDHLTDFVDPNPNVPNNTTPTLTIVGGNNQTAAPGTFNALPFDLGVWNAAGTQPLVNVPVTFTVLSGGGLLAATNTGSPTLSSSLVLFTDAVGTVQSYYKQPAGAGVSSQIRATAGLAQVTLSTATTSASTNTDSDDLPDAWEIQYFGNLSATNGADPDGDGLTNLQEYQNSTDPTNYYNGTTPVITVLAGGGGQPGDDGLLKVSVKNASGTLLVNAPVSFAITAGGSQLAASAATGAALAGTQSVRTLTDGTASVYYRTPAGQATAGTVSVQAGSASASLVFAASAPPFPSALSIDFETGEGYVSGPLSSQQGWTSFYAGTVVEADATAPSGGKVLRLSGGSWASHPVTPAVASGLVFIDFYAKVAVAADYWNSSQFELGGAALSFTRVGSGTAADVLAGNTGELGGYEPTGAQVALDGSRTTAWHRYSLRQDYDSHRWDFYVDGKLIAADVFLSGLPLDRFYAMSDTALPGWVDSFRVTGANPLFTDADRDGMDDAWELAHSLSLVVNDRDLDPDHDGLTNIREYLYGTDPHIADSDDDEIPDGWEVLHGLNPKDASDAAFDTDGDGLTDAQEFLANTDPRSADTNGNGISDSVEDADGDGVNTLQELTQGTNPNDFFNGIIPVITTFVADGGVLPDGELRVKVTAPDGTPYRNALVSFRVGEGEHLLTANRYGWGLLTEMTVRTDAEGLAHVFVRPPEF